MRKHKLFIMTIAIFMPFSNISDVFAMRSELPHIAKWYGNKDAAVSLRFDDSLESHVNFVIPKLNEYGIKATFMINPGLGRYKKNKDFWENQVPKMGHELGNHTMHHRGAETVLEAEFEIGEVSRLIWRLYPHRSKLLVFASGGGGVKWGGKYWKAASQDYKGIVKKWSMIDLYDGSHPYLAADSRNGIDALISSLHRAIQEQKHQTIVFHKVDKPNLIDRMKTIYRGYGLTFPHDSFEKLVLFLHQNDNVIWTAPLGDVLKYEKERNSTRLEILLNAQRHLRVALKVDADGKLYDQEMTLVVPNENRRRVVAVRQGGNRIDRYEIEEKTILIPVKPANSVIEIQFQ